MKRIDWFGLRAELAIWRHQKQDLPFWWRDDDAVAPTKHLDRLAELSEATGVPIHLAVIPAQAQEALARYVHDTPHLRPVVHGWAHKNHAPDGVKSSEFGTPRADAAAQARDGLARLRALFGPAVLPVFVPPWNRIDDALVTQLASSGYGVLSTYGPRGAAFPCPGLEQINTHIDPVDWRGTRGLADPELVLARLVAQLQSRRVGDVDATEPLGLLTHHLMQDDATWKFCAALVAELAGTVRIAKISTTEKDLK